MEHIDSDPSNEMEFDSSSSFPFKIWSNSETDKLISLYKRFIPEVGERFRYQKDMWIEISSYFTNKTPIQCETRLATVLRRRKKYTKELSIPDAGKKSDKKYTVKLEKLKKSSVEWGQDDDLLCVKNQLWPKGDTKRLVNLYKSFLTEVGPNKKFKQKKDMWSEISTYFSSKSAKQCETRLLHVLNKNRTDVIKYIRPNSPEVVTETTNESVEPTFDVNPIYAVKDEMIELTSQENFEFHTQEMIEIVTPEERYEMEELNVSAPEILQEKEELERPNEFCTLKNKPLTVHERKDKSIQEILLEISAKKEEAKERRHREKLEVVKQTQNILQQILNVLNK